MEKFTIHTGTVALLERDNVDTDQIIPKQFLKRTERTGYGDCLFFDWRLDAEGRPRPEFPLNAPQYAGASILVAGKNFGCGSSREHAVWALRDYGFRCVIAPAFADIFANNCVKNGLLTVVLGPGALAQIKNRDAAGRFRLTVDLVRCEISGTDGFKAHFDVDSFRRRCLLEGLDEIGMTLQHEGEIAGYEARNLHRH
ncbi:MAG TPA: 3-isopropylmalate dehydratase small subunit [Candidatus Angelobacter sp.]